MKTLRSIRDSSDRPDGRTSIIFAVVLFCLWGARFGQNLVPKDWTRLAELNWWAGTQILFYGIVPLALLAVIGLRPTDLGWKVSGTLRHAGTYAVLLLAAIPFVVIVSGSESFQAHYPILEIEPGQGNVWRDLALWWPLYAVQFAAIESFFRGVLVLGLSRLFGSAAIFVAVIPYMMIHFVKPPAEAAASVIGGVVLGFLALRTGSIVWGIALHIAVAASMDTAALVHKDFLW